MADLIIDTIAVSGTSTGPEIFAAQSDLVAAVRSSGRLAYARDTEALFFNSPSGWHEVGGEGILKYSTEVALLAATPADGNIGYAVDTATYYFRQSSSWVPFAVSGGEANVGGTVGLGVPVYFGKSGVTLQFRSITAGSSKLSVTQNTNDVGLDVVPANIAHQSLSGAGSNTHAQIDTAITSISAKANDSAVVHNTGAETIAGAKTFSSTIVGSVSGNAATATTIPSLSGDVSNSGNAVTLSNAAVIGKVLTGYASGAGTVASTDSLLQAIQKLNGNVALKRDTATAIDHTTLTSIGTNTHAQLDTAIAAAAAHMANAAIHRSINDSGTATTDLWSASKIAAEIAGAGGGPVDAGDLVGTVLAAGVTASSLTSVGTLVDLAVTNPITGDITGNAATVTTNANLTGDVMSSGNATTLSNSAVTGQALTGYVSGAGTITSSDSLLAAIQKLNGNIALKATDSAVVHNTGAETIAGAKTFSSTIVGSVSGNASTVTTNANLTGDVTSSGNATTLTNSAVIGQVLTGYTSGAGTVSAADSLLAAIQKLNGNIALKAADSAVVHNTGTETIAGVKTFSSTIVGSVNGNAATVTTNANLTGDVTSSGNAATLTNSAVTGQALTGYVSGAGAVAATDSILAAIQKLNGNDALKALDSAAVHNTGTETIAGSKTFSSTIIGSISGNAATVTTNANLTGDVTSSGNATTLSNTAVTGQAITGYVSGAGTVAATDTILQAIQKLNGNAAAGGAAAAGTLTGTTLASNVVTSSLTSIGVLGAGTVTAPSVPIGFSNTGLLSDGSHGLKVTTNGVLAATISSAQLVTFAGNVIVPNGTPGTSTSIGFNGGNTDGFAYSASGVFIMTGGNNILACSNSGTAFFRDISITSSNILLGGTAQVRVLGYTALRASKASSYTVTTGDSGKVFDNAGAGGTVVTFTLPAAALNQTYTFCNILTTASSGIAIAPNSGSDTIAYLGKSAGATITSPVATQCSAKVTCTSANTWAVEFISGTWT